MIKTSDVVKKLLLRSDTAQLAASEGWLNVSAFARSIQPQVEKLTMKTVSVGTITIALYRLLESYSFRNFKPTVWLSELVIHSEVCTYTYAKASLKPQHLSQLISELEQVSEKPFYTLTQGPEEITLIADQSLKQIVNNQLDAPQAQFDDLVAISVKFNKKYLEVPNMMYSLFASLAVRRINVIETVSTLTSLTFVIHATELTRAIEALRPHLKSQQS